MCRDQTSSAKSTPASFLSDHLRHIPDNALQRLHVDAHDNETMEVVMTILPPNLVIIRRMLRPDPIATSTTHTYMVDGDIIQLPRYALREAKVNVDPLRIKAAE